jgi:hypothetical protein
MTAQPTWPAGPAGRCNPQDDPVPSQLRLDSEQLDEPHASAYAIIGEMAGLLRETRGKMLASAGFLGALAIGIALEAGICARAPRHGLAGAVNIVLMCPLFFCWLVAVILVAMAGRPVLNALSEIRWLTRSPLDPRAPWLTLPPVGAHPDGWAWTRAHLLLGAARMARYRVQAADTWTCVAAACFLVWTAMMSLGW